jgi:RHS repeat-associated protein
MGSGLAETSAPIMRSDGRGNQSVEQWPDGSTITVAYDGFARLTRYKVGLATQDMLYNGDDERIRVVTTPAIGPSDTRIYMYDLDHRIVGEYGGTGITDIKAEYIWTLPEIDATGLTGGDDGTGGYMPLAIVKGSAGEINWVHSHHNGKPLLMTNVTGAIVAYSGHAVLGFPGQFANAVGLAGAQYYYNRYRDYNDTTGRYIQADPIGLAGDANPYAYAMGNTLRYSDPTGEFAFLLPILYGAAIGAGTDLAFQAGMNLLGGRPAFACINWTQVGAAGALGAISGGVGSAGLRTAAGLSTKFANVSRRVRRAEGLVGSGKDLHHWAIPKRFETAFGGRAARFVNGRWNLNPMPRLDHINLHSNPNPFGRLWVGSPSWAKATAGIGLGSIGGGMTADGAGLNKDCGCGQ